VRGASTDAKRAPKGEHTRDWLLGLGLEAREWKQRDWHDRRGRLFLLGIRPPQCVIGGLEVSHM
jgi:hypothetical protein